MDLRQHFASADPAREEALPEAASDAEVDRAYMSRVERAGTYVGLEIGKLATILEVEPSEFFRSSESRSRKKTEPPVDGHALAGLNGRRPRRGLWSSGRSGGSPTRPALPRQPL
jgi:hypothetical protein